MLRLLLTCAFTVLLTACGQATQDPGNLLQKSSDECAGTALPRQFIVKHLDGSLKVVQAESEEALIKGYLTEHYAQVEFAEHDQVVKTALPAQSVHASKSGADNWGTMRIDADKLWAQGARGSGVIVAVVDTGVDINHPQLQNQVLFNAGENGRDGKGGDKQTNGIDDDKNGYIDDYAGYNFVTKHGLTGDNQYHGTHVAGIVAAAHQDTVAGAKSYVQGVAPQVKILPVAFLDSKGSGLMSDAAAGILYAVARGAQVINASWGGTGCSKTLNAVIAGLEANNVVFVNAAGNETLNVDLSMEYPASLNLTPQITVGATGDHNYMAEYSNYGIKAVHIFAPGSDIVSTLPDANIGPLSGTSMATPFVTGAVALLLSQIPDATASQIRAALYNSAMHDAGYINASHGRLDLAQALVQLHQFVGH